MGKSRLSLELGHLIKGDYEHGATFIDLSPIRKPEDIAQYTATTLGLNVDDDQDPQDVLFNYCREKELLLIFDNFEHVLSHARLLADILEVAPKITIIATSRERLNLRVETVYALKPVNHHGFELFLEVASMMRPTIIINDDELEDIHNIVELVGGLPLGLILAATWVDVMPVAEIADEIQSNLDFLSSDMGDMPERQRSIHAVINPTWNRLTDKEQKAFMWASVFRGGFTRQLFQELTGASARTLQTLLSRSLITHGHGRRYDMHPLLRQYAREKLEVGGTLEQAKQAHLQTLLNYVQSQNEDMYKGQYLESLEKLDSEQDNCRAALDWSLDGHELDNGVSLLLSLCDFWSIRSQSIQAHDYLEQALEHRQSASLYSELTRFQARLGQTDNVSENLQEAIALAKTTGDKETLASTYRRQGLHLISENSDEARDFLEQATALAIDTGNQRIIADCYISMGSFWSQNHSILETAIHYNQEALAIYEEIGDLRGISMATYNNALEYIIQGDTQKSRELCEYSLKLKLQIGDRAGAARRLAVLASWDIVDEEFEQASAYLTESRVICEELGEQSRLVYTLAIEGLLALIMTEYSQAKVVLERGLKIALAISDSKYIEVFCGNLALLYLMQQKPQAAKPYVIQALQAHNHIIQSGWICIVAYINYLWYVGQIDSCISIAAITIHHADNGDLHNKYFLQPLYYRIQQTIGADAWKESVEKSTGISIEQLYQDIMSTSFLTENDKS